MSRQKSNNRGFSLLEVMVAVAVLAVGIVVVLQALTFAARSAGISCDTISASFLAADKMQELEFRESNANLSQEATEEKGSLDKFSWSSIITPEASLNLFKSSLAIEWKGPNRQESLKLTTYLRNETE